MTALLIFLLQAIMSWLHLAALLLGWDIRAAKPLVQKSTHFKAGVTTFEHSKVSPNSNFLYVVRLSEIFVCFSNFTLIPGKLRRHHQSLRHSASSLARLFWESKWRRLANSIKSIRREGSTRLRHHVRWVQRRRYRPHLLFPSFLCVNQIIGPP